MQTDVVSQRISTAAHSLDRQLVGATSGQLVFDDQRIRGWTNVIAASITQPGNVTGLAAALAAGGTLTAATTYTYSVCTVTGNTQATGTIVSATPSGGNLTVNLSWTAVGGATSYNIYRVANSNNFTGFTFLANTAATTYSDTGAVATTAGVPPFPIPYVFDVGLDSVPNIWRIRALSNNTLEVTSAAVADTPVFSANLITQACIAGYGVAIVVTSSTSVDIFYCITASGGGVTIQTQHYNGSVWSGTASIVTLNTQPLGSCVMLDAPNPSTLFYTDSSANNGTTINAVVLSGGTWKTPAVWDLSPQNIGVSGGGITVPGEGSWFSTISAVPTSNANEYLLAFFALQPINTIDQGIYTMLVSNVVASGTATSAFWRSFNNIYSTNASAMTLPNSPFKGRQLFLLFPRLQMLNGLYWLSVMQASQFAGNVVQQYHFMKSLDGRHWYDRQIAAGTDYVSTTYTFANLLYAEMLVSANRTFFFGYDVVYRTQSTSMLGIANPNMQLDVSADVPTWSYTRSSPGQSSTATIDIFNANGKYNASSILRRGARLIRKCGYVTSNGAELLTYMTEIVTRVEQTTRMTLTGIQNILRVSTRDYAKKLAWISDEFQEFFSGHHINIGTTSFASGTSTPTSTGGFQDLTPVAVWNGTFFISGGELHPGILDVNSQYNDNLCVLNTQTQDFDGILELRFKGISSWTGTYLGVALQVKDYTHYYAVTYNLAGDNKFDFVQSTPNPPSTAPGAKINSYTRVSGFTPPGAVTLTNDQYYWLRVEQYHNTISVYYSADPATSSTARQTWVKVFSFQSVNVPTTVSNWGILAKGNLTVSTPIGQLNTVSTDTWNMTNDPNPYNPNGEGTRVDFAMRVQPTSNGILRSVSIILGRFTNGVLNLPPDVVVGLVLDNGAGTHPADLSNPSNVLFAANISASSIPIANAPNSTPWTNVLAPSSLQITGGQFYWIWVHAASSMTVTQMNNSQWVGFPAYDAQTSTYPTVYDYHGSGGTSTPIWQTFIDGNTNVAATFDAYINVSLNTNGTVFSNYNFASGEFPKTTEYIANEIATRSSIPGCTFDSTLQDSFSGTFDTGADGTTHNWFNGLAGTWATSGGVLTGFAGTGAYGFARSNSSKGLLDDTVIDCDFLLTTSAMRAGFIMRFLGDPSTLSSCSGYYIEFQPQVAITGGTADFVNFYRISAGVPSLLYSSPIPFSLPINTTFHVTIDNRGGFYRVYVWDAIAAQFYDATVITQGYVGFGAYSNNAGGAVANWDNYRIPDIKDVQDYYAIAKKDTGKQALERLIGGNLYRIKYFARFDGTLKISQFNNRQSLDTYQVTLSQVIKTDTDDYWFSDLEAEEDTLYARRFSPDLQDSDGRRYKTQPITAYTDQAGYNLEFPALRFGEELSLQNKFVSPCVPSAEPEDVVTLVNSQDGQNLNVILNDFQITYEPKSNKFTQTVGCRLFVS